VKVGSKPSSTCGRRPLAVAASAVACAAACTAALAGVSSHVRPQGLLAFHADPGGDSGLYVMSADGSDVRLTSSNLAGDPFSRWSPDGTRLLFLSGAYGEGALRLLDLRAKRERTIGSDTVRAYAWSPDGRSLVYESDDATMWIAPAGGAGKPRRLGRGHGPDWSPDGRWIAYFDVSGDPDVFKLPVRGGKPVRLTGRRGADFSPQWSPNGRTIAFVSERDGNTELYVVSADGLRTRRLTRDPAPDEAFQWAPDGRRLAYVSYRDGAEPTSIGIGNAEIRTVDIATGRVVQLTHNRVWDGDPAWSPDGRWLAFTRRAGYGEVGVMRADGSELRFLHGAVNAPFNDCCPSWRPARR
jgi:Tol biopolymer transport system component